MDCYDRYYELLYQATRKHLDSEKAEFVLVEAFREAIDFVLKNPERTPLTTDSLVRRVRIGILARLRRMSHSEPQPPATVASAEHTGD